MRRQVLIGAVVGLVLAPNSQPLEARRADLGEQSERAEFTYYERCIFLKVQVGNDADLLFLVDTGASASAIDLRTAERLGLSLKETVKVEGASGVIDAKTVLIPWGRRARTTSGLRLRT